MNKGGRTSTTWETGSKWKSGETKTVRIPIVLEAQVMAYAKELDANNGITDTPSGNDAKALLEAIDRYIELKQQNYHPNQHSKQLDTSTRSWDELRKLKKLLEENPQALGLG